MESNLKDKAPQVPLKDETVTSGGDSSEQRISELSTALQVVKMKFDGYRKKLKAQIWVWGSICIIIIIFCVLLSIHLLNESFNEKWSWQIAYISVIRITIAGAVFSLASFCFKILKSYIHLNEHNTHCITVIESMANLVGAAKDEQQRNLIYGKLIDIIIHFADPGFLSKDEEFKTLGNLGTESIKKALDKL